MKDMKISGDSVVKKIDGIVASEIDGETVMMSIEQGEYFGLDLIGSDIWEIISAPVKVSDLIDSLLEKYEVDRETCERDVLAFLNKLSEHKILSVTGED